VVFNALNGKTTLSLDDDGDISGSTGDLSTGPNDGGWLL
jgi:hypothetical protein